MSFFQKTGSFTVATSTGNQSVTGVGFVPKFIIFYATDNTGTSRISHCHNNIGYTDGITHFVLVGNSEDGVGTTDTVRDIDTTHCVKCNIPGASTIRYSGTFVSFDADGFTINVDSTAGNAYHIHYQAFGGSDILNVTSGSFLFQAATGDQVVTGVGFQPDFMFFGTIDHTDLVASQQHNLFSWGFTDGTNDVCYSHRSENNLATSDCNRYQTTSQCIRGLNSNGSIDFEGDLKSFDSDGFTINVTDGAFAPKYIIYIAIESNLRWKVGSFNMSTSTGNTSTTGIGFKPMAGCFISHAELSNSALSRTDVKNVFGIAGPDLNTLCCGGTDDDNVATTNAMQWRDTKLLQIYFTAGGLHAEADLNSWDTDGFTLNYTTAPSSALEVIYWVVTRKRNIILI